MAVLNHSLLKMEQTKRYVLKALASFLSICSFRDNVFFKLHPGMSCDLQRECSILSM
jgi:hypothetical protein